MSEYNIQMNKYNALSDDYDQLYPKPMKHASTHAKDSSDPILPSSIGAYSKNEVDTLLANKADASSVYTKEESISAETRTALSLAETATPDAAFAEIARQLSEMTALLWENAAPTSTFEAQTISLDLSAYKQILVSFIYNGGTWVSNTILCDVPDTGSVSCMASTGGNENYTRRFNVSKTGIVFQDGIRWATYGSSTGNTDNKNENPYKIYGIKDIT